ncbi:prepilin-type N-terminal cleavage/methylation domain-containing protein [Chloroflexota bacterium]
MGRVRLSNKAGKAFRGRSPGFTLIEVLITLALFAIIAIVFAGGLSTASRAVTIADIRTRAESLARTQMESVKEQDYVEAPDGGVHNYTKIQDIPEGYSICSFDRSSPPSGNCDPDDPIIAIPWDSENNIAAPEDDGLQKITLVIKHEGREIITLEGYKVFR